MAIPPPILAFTSPLLARDDGENWTKLVGIAVVVLFWVVGGIASAVSKSRKQREEQTWTGDAVPPVPAAPPIPLLPPVPRATTPPAGYPPPVTYPAPVSPAAYRPAARPPALPPASKQRKPKRPKQRAAERDPTVARPDAMVPAAAATTAEGRRTNAGRVRAMMTPEALRAQYVVAELFDPPPGARGDTGPENSPRVEPGR